MMQVYKIDSDGYYIEPVVLYPRYEDTEYTITPEPYTDDENYVITLEAYTESRITEVYEVPKDCVEVQPPSYYKAQWRENDWHETGQAPIAEPQPPTTEEKVANLEEENEDLKSSIAFLEDMIVILTMP